METKKAFIKSDQDIILPITRGELVLDSSGEIALHSQEFAATEDVPGLMTPTEKTKIAQMLFAEDSADSNIVQIQKTVGEKVVKVYPTTLVEGVLVPNGTETITLSKVIEPILNMDTTPTKGSTRAVTSGGIWQNIENTVGAIYQTVITI